MRGSAGANCRSEDSLGIRGILQEPGGGLCYARVGKQGIREVAARRKTQGGVVDTRPAVVAARRTSRADQVYSGGEWSSASTVKEIRGCSRERTSGGLGVPRAVYVMGGGGGVQMRALGALFEMNRVAGTCGRDGCIGRKCAMWLDMWRGWCLRELREQKDKWGKGKAKG